MRESIGDAALCVVLRDVSVDKLEARNGNSRSEHQIVSVVVGVSLWCLTRNPPFVRGNWVIEVCSKPGRTCSAF